mmetsp:Transcript_5985/g.10262  ORF Transcript_5985/g.10262 Transcript_5985/m.10262 type:complete len:283 (-) Transcript_5985:125-973(-)
MVDMDHYDALGVSPRASVDEVKRAYRTLSKLYHPDKAGNLDEVEKRERERRMVALNIAYQVLSSPRKRWEYDMTGEEHHQPEAHQDRAHARAPTVPATHHAVPRPGQMGTSQQPSPSADGGRCGGHESHAQPGFLRIPRPGGGRLPRYQLGAKYTYRSRQARRMDPSQYTTHIDGRAAEFAPSAATRQPSTSSSSPGAREDSEAEHNAQHDAGGQRGEAGLHRQPRTATWLQKQMDIAHAWEQAHCPEPAETEQYQWRKESDNWLRNIRERRQRREQGIEEN